MAIQTPTTVGYGQKALMQSADLYGALARLAMQNNAARDRQNSAFVQGIMSDVINQGMRHTLGTIEAEHASKIRLDDWAKEQGFENWNSMYSGDPDARSRAVAMARTIGEVEGTRKGTGRSAYERIMAPTRAEITRDYEIPLEVERERAVGKERTNQEVGRRKRVAQEVVPAETQAEIKAREDLLPIARAEHEQRQRVQYSGIGGVLQRAAEAQRGKSLNAIRQSVYGGNSQMYSDPDKRRIANLFGRMDRLENSNWRPEEIAKRRREIESEILAVPKTPQSKQPSAAELVQAQVVQGPDGQYYTVETPNGPKIKPVTNRDTDGDDFGEYEKISSLAEKEAINPETGDYDPARYDQAFARHTQRYAQYKAAKAKTRKAASAPAGPQGARGAAQGGAGGQPNPAAAAQQVAQARQAQQAQATMTMRKLVGLMQNGAKDGQLMESLMQQGYSPDQAATAIQGARKMISVSKGKVARPKGPTVFKPGTKKKDLKKGQVYVVPTRKGMMQLIWDGNSFTDNYDASDVPQKKKKRLLEFMDSMPSY